MLILKKLNLHLPLSDWILTPLTKGRVVQVSGVGVTKSLPFRPSTDTSCD